MAAATRERIGANRTVKRDVRPLAANVKVFKGTFAACYASGFYGPATGNAGEVVVGRWYQTVDNTGGANGAASADLNYLRERELTLAANDTGTAVTVADRERLIYMLDDQTVTGNATKGPAGVCYDVTQEGVWFEAGVAPLVVTPAGADE
jgi:hypothetical protein